MKMISKKTKQSNPDLPEKRHFEKVHCIQHVRWANISSKDIYFVAALRKNQLNFYRYLSCLCCKHCC